MRVHANCVDKMQIAQHICVLLSHWNILENMQFNEIFSLNKLMAFVSPMGNCMEKNRHIKQGNVFINQPFTVAFYSIQ